MPVYYYFFLIIALSLIIFFIRAFLLRKKNIPAELFVEALRNENSGHFEAAVISYKSALNEVKKNRLRSISMENRINEKIKVLHTIIEYKNSLRFPG